MRRAPVRASVSTPIGRTVRLRLIRALSQPAKHLISMLTISILVK